MSDKPTPLSDVMTVLRGMLMGAADIVPGVSGGTVALLLGIYPRLLTAISHVDGRLFGLVRSGKWREAAAHLDVRFLVALAGGIGASVLLLTGLIKYVLEQHTQATMSVFFGLILASGILVLRMVGPKTKSDNIQCVVMAILGSIIAAWMVLGGVLQPRDSLAYVFGSGAIAICAMILPGISGSYLLVLLGKYEQIIGIIHHLKAGEITKDELLTLVVFACGCLIGLLLFSKVLKALLARYYVATMALLGGFMLGSLAKVWPWQVQVIGAPEDVTRPVWPIAANLPEGVDPQIAMCVLLAVVAFAFVLTADLMARNRQKTEDAEQAAAAE